MTEEIPEYQIQIPTIRRVFAYGVNCWQSFLSSVLDDDLEKFKACATTNDDWREQTDKELAARGLCFIEAMPGTISQLPEGCLVGCHINGINAPHIVIARVLREGPRHAFKVEHDPAGKSPRGKPINPHRIVLIAKLWQ